MNYKLIKDINRKKIIEDVERETLSAKSFILQLVLLLYGHQLT